MSIEPNLEVLAKAFTYFSPSDYPFLKEYRDLVSATKPYKGLRILHNVHLTMSTLCKIETLFLAGAEVVVTATEDLSRSADALKLLAEANIPFYEPSEINGTFDVVLDCCAGFYHKITPRVGAVELTQTGIVKYEKDGAPPYPVISVDDSMTKNIESFYGTGDGFLRGLEKLASESFVNKKFIVFGFGKVGKGVLHSLIPYTNQITVIEKRVEAISEAFKYGYKGVYYNNLAEIESELKDAFCVVTATGEEDLITKNYNKKLFENVKYLINIGSHDEFGKNFKANDKRVLFGKKPINFCLQEPTRMKYLDPIFYMHNAAIDVLLADSRKTGVYSFPIDKDLSIIHKWSSLHKIDTSLIFDEGYSSFSSNLAQNLLAHIPCYVYWKDKNYVYQGCNHLFAKAAGLEFPNQIVGKTDFDLAWGKTEGELFQKSDREVMSGIYKINFIEPQYQADGTTKTVLASKVPYFDKHGNVEGVLGIFVDITDQKKQEILEKQKIVLDEKVKVLQLMGGAVAHELRTPLAAIKLAAQAVERLLPKLFEAYHLAVDNKLMKPVTNEAHFKIIETVFQNIQEEVNASNVFIDNMLLNIQQLAADPKDMEALSMKKCVEDALQRFPFDEKSRAFTTADVDYDFMFKGMPVLMQHVIFNLLRNGIYYVLEATKDEAGIKIWTAPGKDGWHELHFKDTGTGISQEHMKHVFERFFSKRYHGTGVGLAFCKQVITQFGGTIACESKEGEYTHFIMSFPPVDEKKELIQG